MYQTVSDHCTYMKLQNPYFYTTIYPDLVLFVNSGRNGLIKSTLGASFSAASAVAGYNTTASRCRNAFRTNRQVKMTAFLQLLQHRKNVDQCKAGVAEWTFNWIFFSFFYISIYRYYNTMYHVLYTIRIHTRYMYLCRYIYVPNTYYVYITYNLNE
jgi:hypothetical protein